MPRAALAAHDSEHGAPKLAVLPRATVELLPKHEHALVRKHLTLALTEQFALCAATQTCSDFHALGPHTEEDRTPSANQPSEEEGGRSARHDVVLLRLFSNMCSCCRRISSSDRDKTAGGMH